MRVEPFGVDSIVHIVQRGTRGMEIVHDREDKDRFVRSLLYLNDEHQDTNWHRKTHSLYPEWPADWPERDHLVRVLGWTLLTNHFHLLVQEIKEGGIARFMQRQGGSMSMCYNRKYQQKGSLFQSSYTARVVSDDTHLTYLPFYILVKNTLEMYPGGITEALRNFDRAWDWARCYPYSSLGAHTSGEPSLVDDPEQLVSGIIGKGDSYKEEARELLARYEASRGAEWQEIMLEAW